MLQILLLNSENQKASKTQISVTLFDREGISTDTDFLSMNEKDL